MIEENVIQITGGITTNVNVSVKNVMYVKKSMFGILLHVTNCENGKYLVGIMDDSVIICDEVIDVKAKSDDEKTNSPNKYNL